MDINNKEIHICIPAFKEDKISSTLNSLFGCDQTGISLQISILVNASSEATDDVKRINEKCIQDIIYFKEKYPEFPVNYEYFAFPQKHAGVGLARKTLMDKASEKFKSQGINGLVVALDADTIVEENYLQSIAVFFENSSYSAASIHYEHPLNSKEIIEYEFHLRYYNSMQHHTGFPFAFHTVGSAMVCTSDSYLKKGGMNKRKAGEDFYFMQKFIKDEVCGNITETTIIPSSRSSDRVPFGTGRAILKYNDENYLATTYNPQSFIHLKEMNGFVNKFYDDNSIHFKKTPVLHDFLIKLNFEENLASCVKNTSSKKAFLKRFYQYFDAFTLMKCLHFMRTEFADISVTQAAKYYSENLLNSTFETVEKTLLELRKEELKRFRMNN